MNGIPGFYFLVAMFSGLLSVALPAAILGVIGFSILGCVDAWKERHEARKA